MSANNVTTVIGPVLDGWRDAINERQPERVAEFFTEDALFQGLHPEHSIGRPGVVDYYRSQPVGLRGDYRVLESSQLASDVIVAYVHVDFSFADGRVLPVHLTLVLREVGGVWLISHYHVSRIEA